MKHVKKEKVYQDRENKNVIVKRMRHRQSVPAAAGTNLSVPVDHHLLCKAHFNWITPQTSSLLRRHDGWLGVLRDGQRHSINRRVRTPGAKLTRRRATAGRPRRTQWLTMANQKASVRGVTVRWKAELTIEWLWEKKKNKESACGMQTADGSMTGVCLSCWGGASSMPHCTHRHVSQDGHIDTVLQVPEWSTRGIIIFPHPQSTKQPLSRSLALSSDLCSDTR